MNPEYYMAKAIQLAKKGWYSTHPNPRVGCILVKNQHIIGQGYHKKVGLLHAEREAIQDALAQNQDITGATAYVTLEPCCHYGQTPPCTNALIEYQIKEVFIGQRDPNPIVSGKGIKDLEKAGILVHKGILEKECKALNFGFNKRMEQHLPWIRCKLAMSLDGRTAMKNGESQWISSTESRQDVQHLRAQSSAIVTGVGTVLADNPSMNVRLDKSSRQPLRVILDSQLKTPPQANILNLDGRVIIFCYPNLAESKIQALEATGAIIIPIEKSTEHFISLKQVFHILAREYEINEVLLETGATLAGQALSQNLIDELVIYMAPHVMGDQARGLFHLPELNQMSERIQLKYQDIRFIGSDLRLTLTR